MPLGAGRRSLATLALLAALLAPSAQAQTARIIHHRSRSFRIPVTIAEDALSRVREVRLWASDDLGYTWKEAGRTPPSRLEFPFKVPRDGEYWFAVQTIDTQGRAFPNGDQTAEPSLKVFVDTTPPSVILEPKGRRASQIAVAWEIQDAHLVTSSFALEYQSQGAREDDWRAVPLRSDELLPSGAKTWDVGTADAVRVRASVKDRAGNLRQAEITIADGLAAAPDQSSRNDPLAPPSPTRISNPSHQLDTDDPFAPQSPAAQPIADDGFEDPNAAARSARSQPPRANEQTPSQTLLVPSPQFPLKYSVEDAGSTGPALVELWVTRDGGRSWSRQAPDADRASPYPVDLGSEGSYGLWLVVQSASGLGDPAPAPGDRPQIWVEVDSTPPQVQLDPPRVGTGTNLGRVLITWRVTDPHLAEKPIVLSYRPDSPEAGWQPITERIANTGRYIWQVPQGVPPRFHVKIDVYDAVGNRASAETTDFGPPVIVDRSRPKGRILGLDQSTSADAENRNRR
jgi:hypothetical protein